MTGLNSQIKVWTWKRAQYGLFMLEREHVETLSVGCTHHNLPSRVPFPPCSSSCHHFFNPLQALSPRLSPSTLTLSFFFLLLTSLPVSPSATLVYPSQPALLSLRFHIELNTVMLECTCLDTYQTSQALHTVTWWLLLYVCVEDSSAFQSYIILLVIPLHMEAEQWRRKQKLLKVFPLIVFNLTIKNEYNLTR